MHSAFHRIQTIVMCVMKRKSGISCTPLFIAFKPQGEDNRCRPSGFVALCFSSHSNTPLSKENSVIFSRLHSAFHRIQTIGEGSPFSLCGIQVALRFSSHSNGLNTAFTSRAKSRCTPLFIAFKLHIHVSFGERFLRCTPLFIAFKRQ